MYARVVTVAGATGGGNQDITFTGGTSFTPKAAILQWTRHAVSDNTFTDGFSFGYGFTDGTSSRCVACVSEDNVTNSDTARIQQNDSIIVALNPSGTITTVDALATFSQWLTNGMRINWSDAPGAAMRITVTFLGGADLTDVTVGTVAATTGASCSVSGLSYQPEWGMFLCTGTTTENSASSTAPVCISLGAVDSSESQWCQLWAHADNSGSNFGRSACYHATRCIVTGDNTGVTGYSVFGNWDATGFTLTNTDTYPGSYPIYYLIGKGGEVKVGNDTEPASTGQQTITTNTDVKGVIILGADVNVSTIGTPGSWISGMGDSTLEDECLSAAEVSGSDPTANVSRHDTDAIYVNITANATAASSTIDDEASLYAVSSTGFTLDWSNIGKGRSFRYITFGSTALTQVSTTTTHKYNTIGLVFVEKTHKYNTIGLVTATKTHKYNTITTVSTTKTHKYDTIVAIGATTKTHKYNTIALVTATKTHKYNVIGLVSAATKTHKYNTLVEISTTKTHKYHTVNAIDTTTKTHLYNVIGLVSTTKTHKYDTIAAIATTDKTHKYNVIGLVSTTKTHKFNTIGLVEVTKTHKYNTIATVSTTKTHIYNTVVAISTTTKTHKYDTIISVGTTDKTHKYNVIGLVTVDKTHKYDTIGLVTALKTHRYSAEGRVSVSKVHKFDTLVSIDTTEKTHKYDTIIAIDTTTKTHKYDVIGLVFVEKTHKYDKAGLISTTKTHKYDTLALVETTTKTHKYNVVSLTEVTVDKTHIYEILELVTATKTHKYDKIVLVDTTEKTHKYNTIGLVTATKTHKYDTLAAIDATTKTHKFHTVVAIDTTTKTHKYNTIAQIATTKTHRYHVDSDNITITVTKTHKYDVEQSIPQEPPGGSVIGDEVSIIFPKRGPKVIDIISSIENVATANVEIYPAIENIAIAQVEVRLEFPNRKFAELLPQNTDDSSSQRRIGSIAAAAVLEPPILQNTVESDPVLPPIIETIENEIHSYIGLEILANDPKEQIDTFSLIEIIPEIQRVAATIQLTEYENHEIESKTEIYNDETNKIYLTANVETTITPKLLTAESNVMTPDNAYRLQVLVDIIKNDRLFE
jgi:hypothetical protein